MSSEAKLETAEESAALGSDEPRRETSFTVLVESLESERLIAR